MGMSIAVLELGIQGCASLERSKPGDKALNPLHESMHSKAAEECRRTTLLGCNDIIVSRETWKICLVDMCHSRRREVRRLRLKERYEYSVTRHKCINLVDVRKNSRTYAPGISPGGSLRRATFGGGYAVSCPRHRSTDMANHCVVTL